ncbi:MAG: lipopolysaccharide biosynthesis protein, partial [Planctomycetes bacterium]|nr:lipopolysaccharide biosynthesis protein [Planctomycetota bacterium]
LQQSIRRGSRWVLAAQIASQVVSLATLAILFRMLGPEPYGLLGMVVPVLLLARIFIARGLDVSTIQHPRLSDAEVSSLFWINQLQGLVAAVLIVATAPLLVWVYGTDDVYWVTVALAGVPVIIALGIQHQALLERRMRVGAVAVIRLAAQVAGAVTAISVARAGGTIGALVAQQYAEWAALAVLVWCVGAWRPRAPWAGAPVGSLVRFGRHYALSSLMFHLTTNVDKILVGAVLGPRTLGLYGQAFNLMMKPVHVVVAPITAVMLPALSRAAGDRTRYAELVLGFFRLIALVMLPAAVGLMIVGPEAMRVLGGPQWEEAGPLLSILAIALLAQGFFNALGSVLASVGRADRLFAASVVVAIVFCTAFTLGVYFDFHRQPTPLPLGVAWSYSLAMVLVVFPPYLWFCLRTAGLPWRGWLTQLRVALPAALTMGLAVGALKYVVTRWLHWSDPVLLTSECVCGALVYVLLARREIGRFVVQLRRRR